MNKLFWTFLGACTLAFTLNVNASSAETISYTGAFDTFAAFNIYSPGDGGSGGFDFEETEITGISKFDPSLGTLTGISLTAQFESIFNVLVLATSVIDFGLSHSVDFAADSMQVSIDYSPASSGTTYILHSYESDVSAFCSSGPTIIGNECFDEFFDHYIANDTADVFALSELILSDFVGEGPVDTLSAMITVPRDGAFTLDNVSGAEAYAEADMANIDLTVEYEFTPIPEPMTIAMLAGILSAAAFFLRPRSHSRSTVCDLRSSFLR